MSRVGEILRRVPHSNKVSTEIENIEEIKLWKVFNDVKNAIYTLKDSQTPEIQRQLKTIIYNGIDSGIRDHKAHIDGDLDGIHLDISVEGTSVENQTNLVEEKTETEYSFIVSGKFISKKGNNGYVKIVDGNENKLANYEAYWLHNKNGLLRLEQVVYNGKVINSESLSPINEKWVSVPNTTIELPLEIKG